MKARGRLEGGSRKGGECEHLLLRGCDAALKLGVVAGALDAARQKVLHEAPRSALPPGKELGAVQGVAVDSDVLAAVVDVRDPAARRLRHAQEVVARVSDVAQVRRVREALSADAAEGLQR